MFRVTKREAIDKALKDAKAQRLEAKSTRVELEKVQEQLLKSNE